MKEKTQETILQKKVDTFMRGFLSSLERMWTTVNQSERALFVEARKRNFEDNLSVLIQTPILPFAERSEQEIRDLIQTRARESKKGLSFVCAQAAAYEENRQKYRAAYGCEEFKEGVCTSVPMAVLMSQRNNPLQKLLNNSVVRSNPAALINHLRKIFSQPEYQDAPQFIYETDIGKDFKKVCEENNIGAGALVVVVLAKTVMPSEEEIAEYKKNPHPMPPTHMKKGHMLVLKRFDEQTNEPIYISFDNNRKNHALSKYRQCGYVVDLRKLIQYEYEKEQQLQNNRMLKSCNDACNS